MSTIKTSMIIELIDKVSSTAKKIENSLGSFSQKTKARLAGVQVATKKVGENIGNVSREAGKLSAKIALIGGGAGWLLKTQLVDTASQFEQFRTVLETVEGSSQKAQKSMDWVSNFAAKTPYELDQVMEAFVKLRAYGINPTDGLLATLGDTASAMGKPLNMAVEAIADAITGENERLKEFGIKAQSKGGRTRYEYSDREGKTKYKVVKSDNREQIRETLAAIWNERYAGAMEKMSKTYKGMMSNLADQWTRFKMMVMQNGAFDFIKGKLEKLLALIDKMAANGELEDLAKRVGGQLLELARATQDIATVVIPVIVSVGKAVKWLADQAGGVKVLARALVAIFAGKLVLSIFNFASALISLGTKAFPLVGTAIRTLSAIFLTNPIGLTVTAIATAAFLIYKYWGPIKQFFVSLWAGIKDVFTSVMDWIEAKIITMAEKLRDLLHKVMPNLVAENPPKGGSTDNAKGGTEQWGPQIPWHPLVMPSYAPPAPLSRPSKRHGTNGSDLRAMDLENPSNWAKLSDLFQVNGTIKVEINSAGVAKVKRIETRGKVDIDVYNGLGHYMMSSL